MPTRTLQTWITRRIALRQRLARVCTSYLLFLMVVTQKHSLEEAARFSGLHKSLFCKMLKSHGNVAVSTLESLSKQQARHAAKSLQALKVLPWKMAILIDSTLQHRASLHPANAKKFHHGKGYVIGHQWTNIVLMIGLDHGVGHLADIPTKTLRDPGFYAQAGVSVGAIKITHIL